jgi:hypothetical protein
VTRIPVSLVVHGQELEPSVLTALLGISPERMHHRGDPVIIRGLDQGRVRPGGYWNAEFWISDDDQQDLVAILNGLLAKTNKKSLKDCVPAVEEAYLFIAYFYGTESRSTNELEIELPVISLIQSLGLDLRIAF